MLIRQINRHEKKRLQNVNILFFFAVNIHHPDSSFYSKAIGVFLYVVITAHCRDVSCEATLLSVLCVVSMEKEVVASYLNMARAQFYNHYSYDICHYL